MKEGGKVERSCSFWGKAGEESSLYLSELILYTALACAHWGGGCSNGVDSHTARPEISLSSHKKLHAERSNLHGHYNHGRGGSANADTKFGRVDVGDIVTVVHGLTGDQEAQLCPPTPVVKVFMDKLKSQFVFLLLGIWGKQKFKDTVETLICRVEVI